MSAWVVSRDHIVFMVKSHNRLNRFDRLNPEKMAALGNMLWQENIKSVQCRYPDCVDNPKNMPGPIGENFKLLPEDFLQFGSVKPKELGELVQLAKSISCYEYQSCEHAGWKDSEAHTFCAEMKESILLALPGWEEAKWGAPNE
jgi:hypothetical protein